MTYQKRTVKIDLTIELDEGMNFSFYESCKKNDPEPFCCGLTKELGNKYSHYSAFSSVSFLDAFEKCKKNFETEKSKRYWGC